MSTEIRLAVPADAAGLRALNRAFNGVDTALPWIETQLARPDATERVFVASESGCLVGFCCLAITHSFCQSQPKAEIAELFVSPDQRGKGIGSALVAVAVRQAGREGATEVFVLTNRWNAAGRRTYQSGGFAAANDVLYRRSTKGEG